MYTQDPMPILDAAAADGIGIPLYVGNADVIDLMLHTTDTTTATIKFQVSHAKDMPNFAGAQSPTNQWDYVDVVDLEDRSAIDGDTGIALSGGDDNRHLEVNANGATWICAIVSGYTQGAISLDATARGENL